MKHERRVNGASQGPILIGFEQIGEVFGRSRNAASRWARDHQMPVAVLPDGRHATTLAWLDGWLSGRRIDRGEAA